MKSSAQVLIVSRDEMLLRTREMILGAFFEVQGAGRFSEARVSIADTAFDLIVLCHSLTSDECERLANLAEEHGPRPLILAMDGTENGDSKSWADQRLGVDAGPYGLLKKCADMLGVVLKNKAKAAQA